MTDQFLLSEQQKSAIVALREDLHRHPEVGNLEFRTTGNLVRALAGLGLEVLRPLPTGCVAVLHGAKPGKTVALRADIDALPVQEATGCAFASEVPGVMHACGHDAHTAALFGAALLLAERRNDLCGTVKFIFQPDEEGDGGAERLLNSGVLSDVSAVFGCHVDPTLPAGTVGFRYGKFYAAADTFDVTVRGKSSHGATPEKGIDALATAAACVTAVRTLPETALPERAVVSVGTFAAGTARNILAGTAAFTGIIRTLGEDTRAAMCARFEETVHKTAAAFGATAEITMHRGYPGVVNHDPETAFVAQTAAALYGEDCVCRIEQPTMTTEDFGYYLERFPGSFYHVGAGGDSPLHSPHFLPPEDTLFTAARLHAAPRLRDLRRERFFAAFQLSEQLTAVFFLQLRPER